MTQVTGKRARLRAIQYLLEYAIAEVQELGLRQVEHLLAAATTTVVGELKGKGRAAATARLRRPMIRLVVDADSYQKGNGTKS
jgi:hypothetical protein